MLYYEIKNIWKIRNHYYPAGIYYCETYSGDHIDVAALHQSNRIWLETDDEVRCIMPNETEGMQHNEGIDMKELAWIKLQAKPMKGLKPV